MHGISITLFDTVYLKYCLHVSKVVAMAEVARSARTAIRRYIFFLLVASYNF
jgi:hypothetical protein